MSVSIYISPLLYFNQNEHHLSLSLSPSPNSSFTLFVPQLATQITSPLQDNLVLYSFLSLSATLLSLLLFCLFSIERYVSQSNPYPHPHPSSSSFQLTQPHPDSELLTELFSPILERRHSLLLLLAQTHSH